MIVGGSVYDNSIRDNYRPRGGKWAKMSKEEARVYDNDPKISAIFALNMDDSNYDDIDEFEYNKDGYAIFPSQVGHPLD